MKAVVHYRGQCNSSCSSVQSVYVLQFYIKFKTTHLMINKSGKIYHRHPGITRLPPPYACQIFPNRSLCTFTHNRVFPKMSGLSPYCCYTCPGFHRTAVVGVRAFTVLLFYSYLNYTQTCIPMDLTNYPPNTITKHLYLELNNTFYSLTKACIRLSQDRSNNWAQTGSPVSLHTYPSWHRPGNACTRHNMM